MPLCKSRRWKTTRKQASNNAHAPPHKAETRTSNGEARCRHEALSVAHRFDFQPRALLQNSPPQSSRTAMQVTTWRTPRPLWEMRCPPTCGHQLAESSTTGLPMRASIQDTGHNKCYREAAKLHSCGSAINIMLHLDQRKRKLVSW